MEFDRAEFWNRKILNWESKRYDARRGAVSAWIGRISNASVQARLRLAAQVVSATLPESPPHLLDLGCGSGRFFGILDSHRFRKMTGIDFSQSGIAEAQARAYPRNAEYLHGDVVSTPWPADADYIVGLGLLDWLDEEQIRQVFAKLQGRRFLFSFSELRRDARLSIHSLYFRMVAGRTARIYRPKYHLYTELAGLLEEAGYSRVYCRRDPSLRFGAFISSERI